MSGIERREASSKLTGRERYVDDLQGEGVLWGMTWLSPVARGVLRGIRFGDGVDWSQCVVVDHRDIPGANEIYLIEKDQPVLVAEMIRHMHEAIVLVAHSSREMCRRAVRAIEFDIEPLDAVLDYRVDPGANQIQHGDDNVLKRLRICKGDVEEALRSAAHVIEGVYETGAQEHVYIENQGMLASVEDGIVVVRGSMQCPYYVLNSLTHALARTSDAVRVVQCPTGGGFGGKEDYPSNIACHVALLALKAGRPVKIIYDREEDMQATTKRHPARVRHRSGVDANGRLVAQDIEMVIDGGAYVTLSPVVLSRGIIHAAGPYACDHVRIEGRAVLTNAVPYGAFRGFGAPQSLFACERHMDVIAERLGIDPVEIRRRNLIRDGESTSTGQVIRDGTDRVALMEHALRIGSYDTRREEHASFNAVDPYRRRGIGLSTIYHGSGFTGSGEVYLKSRVAVEATREGRLEILSANTEMGQGTLTIFTQIVSDALGLEHDDVLIASPDTGRVPNSGPTVASRTVMVVGRLIERACADLCMKLDSGDTLRGEAFRDAVLKWHAQHPDARLLGEAEYEPPPGVVWDDETYKGDAYGTFGWATCVAEVEIDLRTFEARVLDFTSVQEVGRVLNETLARGQIQGGVVQAIGWALMEECRWVDGGMWNAELTNYIIPTCADVPPIRVAFIENPYEHGAQGAKGLGELPMDGPAPAIANAIASALGVDPVSIPLTPERIMALMGEGAHA